MFKIFITVIISSVICGCSNLKELKSKVNAPKMNREILSVRWGKNLDPTYLSGNVPIHLHGPVIHDSVVYIGHSGKGMQAIDERDGKILWSSNEQENYSSSPVIYEDSIIYGAQSGRVYSRKLVSGELNYELDVGASVDGEPVVSKGRLFIQLRNHQVFALDATTGKTLWSYKKSVTAKTSIQGVGKGVVLDNKVYFGFADGDLVSFRVETGDVVWEKKVAQSQDKFLDLNWSIVKFNKFLATTDASGFLYIINANNGEVIQQLDASSSTNLILFDSSIIFGDTYGNIKSVDSSYEVKSLGRVSKRSLTRINQWRNMIISSDIEGVFTLFSLDERTTLFRKMLGNNLSTLFTTPKVGSLGGLVLFTSRGRLYYYR